MVRLLCWSQPACMSWTNRTPRSTSRRAIRQLYANVPCSFTSRAVASPAPPSAPSRGRSARGRSSASGRPSRTARCGWRSPGRRSRWSFISLSFARSSSIPRRTSRLMPSGFDRYSTGSPLPRNFTPWNSARQEAAAPVEVVEDLAAGGALADRGHDDERRQVLAGGAEAVGQPRAHRRPARLLAAGQEEGDGRGVVDRLGVHRLDEAEVVHDLRGVRQEVADPGAGLAVLLERLDPGRAGACRPARRSWC